MRGSYGVIYDRRTIEDTRLRMGVISETTGNGAPNTQHDTQAIYYDLPPGLTLVFLQRQTMMARVQGERHRASTVSFS